MNNLNLVSLPHETPSPCLRKDYELFDSGEGEKLERFGKYVLIRPEPQAIWQRVLSPDSWKSQAMPTSHANKTTSFGLYG